MNAGSNHTKFCSKETLFEGIAEELTIQIRRLINFKHPPRHTRSEERAVWYPQTNKHQSEGHTFKSSSLYP